MRRRRSRSSSSSMPSTATTAAVSHRNVNKAASPVALQEKEKTIENPAWGRSSGVSWLTILGVSSLFFFSPLMTMYFWLACDSYQCSLLSPIQSALKAGGSWNAWHWAVMDKLPRPTTAGFQLYFGWLAFQALLYQFLPAKVLSIPPLLYSCYRVFTLSSFLFSFVNVITFLAILVSFFNVITFLAILISFFNVITFLAILISFFNVITFLAILISFVNVITFLTILITFVNVAFR